jgi:hypothetical protein
MSQYLTKEELAIDVGSIDILLVKTDTYDERQILEKVKKLDLNKLFACALSFSIIGFGNKKFGKVSIKGVIHDTEKIMLENGVKTRSKINEILEPSDLTPRRLCRFFRYQISDYIQDRTAVSYLYRKYRGEIAIPIAFCFAGSEHLVPKEHALGLLSVYKNVDKALATTFTERIIRVLIVRGVLD